MNCRNSRLTKGDITCVEDDLGRQKVKFKTQNHFKANIIIKVEECAKFWLPTFTPNTSTFIVSYLKCTFKTQTVVQTDSDTKIIVKRRYFPSSGTAKEVGGIISASSRKNTVNDTRIEMQSVT